jgi:hypothetical protein
MNKRIRVYQSWLGTILSLAYTAAAVYVVQDELRHSGGGWINLRGLGTALVTFPSQLTLGVVLEWLGVPRVNFWEPGVVDYSQLVMHVVVSATVVYLVGYGVEYVVRRWLMPERLG